MTATTTKLGADMQDAQIEAVANSLRQAWQLGQTYWQQADSESWKQQDKSNETRLKFESLMDETRGLLARQPAAIDKQGARDAFDAWNDSQTALEFEDAEAENHARLIFTAGYSAAPLGKGASKPAPSVEQDERVAFERALREMWQMVDPLNPPPAGTYYRGQHEGIIAALRTIRENFTRAASTPAVTQGEREAFRKWYSTHKVTGDVAEAAWMARAASTSANVAQGAEAVQFWHIVRANLNLIANSFANCRSIRKRRHEMSYLSDQLREHGPSFGLANLCDEAADALDANDARIAALEAKCALLAASLAQSELEVEERDERIAVLLWIPAAFKAQPVAFEAWAAQYGFHAELIDVHQYAKEAARDAWQAGYAAALARHRGETR